MTVDGTPTCPALEGEVDGLGWGASSGDIPGRDKKGRAASKRPPGSGRGSGLADPALWKTRKSHPNLLFLFWGSEEEEDRSGGVLSDAMCPYLKDTSGVTLIGSWSHQVLGEDGTWSFTV